MLGARVGIPVIAVLVAAFATGCTTIVPTSTPGSSIAAVSVAPSAAVATDPSDFPGASAPVSLPPTAAPPATTSKPSKTPRAGATPDGPAGANLVVSKFTLDADPFFVGVVAKAKITIKNEGSADAGIFDVVISYDGLQAGHGGLTDPTTVEDGVPAGSSTQVTVPIGVQIYDTYTMVAVADTYDDVVETNEDDNRADLTVVAVARANLAFKDPGLVIVKKDDGWHVEITFINNGFSGVLNVSTSLNWYKGTESGTFEPMVCDELIQVGIGCHMDEIRPFTTGDYDVTAYLDNTDKYEETDETDNAQSVQVSVP